MITRRGALGLLCVVILAAPTWGGAATAASASYAGWWGPTGMLEGWHIRIPVVVTSRADHLRVNATIGYDVDVRQALLDVGWTSGKVGGSTQLQSFELDEASVRVVEYPMREHVATPSGVPMGDVPSLARLGMLGSLASFNNRTSPGLHIEWVAPGAWPPGVTRSFEIYFDTKANGEKPHVNYSERARAPLEARYWTGAGTLLYGVAASLDVYATDPDTTAWIEVYQYGKPRALDGGSGEEFINPMHLGAGEHRSVEISDVPTAVRIRANKPVLAVGTDQSTAGVIPSTDGGPLGTSFEFNATGAEYFIVAPQGHASVKRVNLSNPGDTYTISLQPGAPSVAVNARGPQTLTSTSPILVFAPPNEPAKWQSPSIWGAPVGSQLIALPVKTSWCLRTTTGGGPTQACPVAPPCIPGDVTVLEGELVVASLEGPAFLRSRDLGSGELQLPATSGGRPARLAAEVEPGKVVRVNAPASLACPTLVHAAVSLSDDAITDGPSMMVVGGSTPSFGGDVVHTPIGGHSATDFVAAWPMQILAYYNGTRVTVSGGASELPTLSLGAGDTAPLDASAGNVVQVRASKPIGLLPLATGGYFEGIDEAFDVEQAGPATLRGYLVSLAPAGDAAEPMVRITGPGTPTTYQLAVTNLARDTTGAGVRDIIHLSVAPPLPGWAVDLSGTDLALRGGETKIVNLTATPPTSAVEGARQTISVTAASEGNPLVNDRLGIVTIVRSSFGVDLWFDRQDGPKIKTITTDPGAEQTLHVLVKNTAQIPDRVLVRLSLLSNDWRATFPDAGAAPLTELALEAGESRDLALRVGSPLTSASQSVLEVSAESESDSSASAKVTATLRHRVDSKISVDANATTLEGAPGDVVTYELTLINRGLERASVRFNTTGVLPPGWERPTILQSEYAIDEISGLAPGQPVALSVIVRIPNGSIRGERAPIHFEASTIPQFVGDPTSKGSLDLLALTAPTHALEYDAPTTVPVDDQGQVDARSSITNHGNGDELARVVPIGLPPMAGVETGPAIVIPRNGSATLEMLLSIPGSTPAGTYAVAADIQLDDATTMPWRFNVTVPERRSVEIVTTGPAMVLAGVQSAIAWTVRNTGNVPLDLPPRIVLPQGWQAAWNESGGNLDVGQERDVTLTLLAPKESPRGLQHIRVDNEWSKSDDLVTAVEFVELHATASREAGGVLVTVTNSGSGDAKDVEAALYSRDLVIDRAIIHRVPPGSHVTAILAAGTAPELHVEVDPSHRYSGGVVLPVSAMDGRHGIPFRGGLVALTAILVACAAVGGRARRR